MILDEGVADVFLSNVEFSAEAATVMSNDEEMLPAALSDEEMPDSVGSSMDRPAGRFPYPGSSAVPNELRTGRVRAPRTHRLFKRFGFWQASLAR